MFRRRAAWIRRFLSDRDEGSVTVEFVSWLPIWMALTGVTTDATLLLHEQSQLFVSARDGARLVALGRSTPEEAEGGIESAFASVAGFDASVAVEGAFVTARLSAPFSSFTVFTGPLAEGTLRAEVSMWVEGVAEEDAAANGKGGS